MAAPRPAQLDQISASIGALETHVEIIRENMAAQHRQTTEILSKLDHVHDRVAVAEALKDDIETIKRDIAGMKPVIAKIEKVEQRVIGAVGLATFVGAMIMDILLKIDTILK